LEDRAQQRKDWLASLLDPGFRLEPASADASFRSYYRVTPTVGDSLILMDAPPAREDSEPFLRIAALLDEVGVHAPEVVHHDLERGFLLLSDLGSRPYLPQLDEDSVERLYGDALAALSVMQSCVSADSLPRYDEALLRCEMALFDHWLLERHLGLTLDATQRAGLDALHDLLVANALEQPQVFVHRDYHSRNLMVTHPNPGVLDFQDAVRGPVTYDLVSLLKDCYIAWPRQRVLDWVMGYFHLAVQMGILAEDHEDRFLRWFDLMGVQRQLKASGIFARLWHRDGKSGYLKDVPRTLAYISELAGDYRELAFIADLIADQVLGELQRRDPARPA
jgi:aminoglycoside/choline kinase family phosphotransferase